MATFDSRALFGLRRRALVCSVFLVASVLVGSASAQSDLSFAPTPQVAPGGDLVVPVRLVPADGVTSIDFAVLYDPLVLQAIAVHTTNYTDSFALTTDLSQADTVQVTLSGGSPLIGNGEIAWIVFTAVGAPGSSSALTWTSTSLNGGAIESTATAGQIDVAGGTDAIFTFDDANGAPGRTVFVPIAADSIDGWTDAAIELHYDPRIVQALGVSLTPLTQGFTLGFNVTQPGVVSVSLSGGLGVTGSGEILEVLLRATGGVGEVSPLALVLATANGSAVPVDDGLFTVCQDADSDDVTLCDGDCDDGDADTYPAAPEVCDGVDNQCAGDSGFGQIDEGFDVDADTYSTCMGDCDDLDAAIHPGVTDDCDGVDNDCNGVADDAFSDADNDLIADCVDCAPLDAANPVPPEVGDSLRLGKAGPGASQVVLNWSDDGVPGPFRLYRGFRKAGSGFSYNHICLGDPIAGTSTGDDLKPLVGTTFTFLITREGCGEAGLGQDSSGAARPNDDPCPSVGIDADGDGTPESIDTCPGIPDPTQTDTDADSHGEICDNCPSTYNLDQANPDSDALGSACDNCPYVAGASQTDTDLDGWGDACDTCPLVSNADQADGNEDGVGDVCSAPVPWAASPLAFGNVVQNQSADRALTLTNVGNAPMTLDSVALVVGSDPAYSLASVLTLPEPIPEGESRAITVRFSPTSLGMVTGTLRLGFADAGLPDIDVTIEATGVEPVVPIAITVIPADSTRQVGECRQLRATAELASGTFVDVTNSANWSSDNTAIATLSAGGLVEFVGTGTATVSAELGGHQGQATVTGTAPGSLRLALPCSALAAGQTFEAEIFVDTATAALGSYALRIVYDPSLVHIVGVAAGLDATFVAIPDVNPADLASGDTKIAAYQTASLVLPSGTVSLARVSFEIVGAAGSTGTIALVAETLTAVADLSDIPWTNVPAVLEVQP